MAVYTNRPAAAGYSDTKIVAAGGTTSLAWTGLDGDTHKQYKIRGQGLTGAGSNITVQINGGGTACTYSSFYQLTAGTILTSSAFAMSTFASSYLSFEATLSAVSGKYRSFRIVSWLTNDAGTEVIHVNSAVRWPDRTSNITSVSLVTSVANGWGEGYVATLYQVV
jgi:hypothetical protein